MKRIEELRAATCPEHNEVKNHYYTKLLVQKAREILGYLPNTATQDIWWIK